MSAEEIISTIPNDVITVNDVICKPFVGIRFGTIAEPSSSVDVDPVVVCEVKGFNRQRESKEVQLILPIALIRNLIPALAAASDEAEVKQLRYLLKKWGNSPPEEGNV